VSIRAVYPKVNPVMARPPRIAVWGEKCVHRVVPRATAAVKTTKTWSAWLAGGNSIPRSTRDATIAPIGTVTASARDAAAWGQRVPSRVGHARCLACFATPVPAPRNSADLKSPWAMRWNTAAANAPIPQASIMKPICAMVEKTRRPFTSGLIKRTADAYPSVSAPAQKTTAIATTDPPIAGEKRRIRMAPALTTPAWIRADTGVGAAKVAGSQPWNGTWLDRASAGITSRVAIKVVRKVGSPAIEVPRSVKDTSPPVVANNSDMATTKGRSPIAKRMAVRRTPSRA